MKQMKHKLTHNLGLKLISVLIASLIWLFVSNNNDPEVTRGIRNVPITLKNQELITEINKSFTVDDGIEKVNIYVTGRKSVTNRLNANSFTVKADLQNYNEALGTVPLEVSCTNNKVNQENIRIIPSTISLSMEDKIEESFGVAVTISGKPEKGFEIGRTSIVTGDSVKIAGPESLVRIIGKVTIAVDVTDIDEDLENSFPIRVEDKNGDLLSDSQMSKLEIKNSEGVILPESKAKVAIEIWKCYRDIPLAIDVVGKPAPGYRISKITLTPKTVNLVGDQKSMEELGEVLKLKESISVEGMTEKNEYDLDLNDTLNQYDNIRLESDTTSAVKVNIEIAESGSRTISLPISALEMKNIPKEKKLIFSPADYVSVNVKATEMNIEEITPEAIKGSIDLKNCMINDSYTIPVDIELPKGYELIGDVTLVVNIEDMENEAEVEANREDR